MGIQEIARKLFWTYTNWSGFVLGFLLVWTVIASTED